MKSAIVDSSCNILYTSYYVRGLTELGYKVVFKNEPFVALNHNYQFTPIIVDDIKVIVDYSNFKNIENDALNWCDVYAKVNLDPSDAKNSKLLGIGPLIALKIFNPISALALALSNLIRSGSRISNKRKFLSFYKALLIRPKLEDYNPRDPIPNQSNYVFFGSSLWKKEPATNRIRSRFIEVCKDSDEITFEGGFAPRSKRDIKGYEVHTIPKRYTSKEFLQKTRASIFVFNTPSVGGCNGWKLAEFLAMGKPIISTPLVRLMPDPYKNDYHYIETSGSRNSISDCIERLVHEEDTRLLLSKNALEYFHSELAPKVVIHKILAKGKSLI